MTITFDINRLIDHRSVEDLNTAQHQFLKSLEKSRKIGEFDILLNGPSMMRAQSILQENFALDCPSRTIESFHTFSCGLYLLNI